MSGKPASRQSDMTKVGGPIVQGSAGVMIGAPTGVACSVCPGGMTTGEPVNPLLGAKVLPGEVDVSLPDHWPMWSAVLTAVTVQKPPPRWVCSAPAGKHLPISAYRYATMN